jgi:hypothetical protein
MNPDHYIEEFWISFKTSMNNFYQEFKCLSRPINFWSDNLNKLQKNKDYHSIEINIRDYMSLYAIDLLRHNTVYHIGILITNIKRWNKISERRFDMCDVKYINIVFLLIDIYNLLTDKCSIENKNISILFSVVEIYIIHEDFKIFIDYAIKNNKPSIIDRINEFEYKNNKNSGIKYIEDCYNVKLSPQISARKIFNQLKLETKPTL